MVADNRSRAEASHTLAPMVPATAMVPANPMVPADERTLPVQMGFTV